MLPQPKNPDPRTLIFREMGSRLTADGYTEFDLTTLLRTVEIPAPSPHRLPLWLE